MAIMCYPYVTLAKTSRECLIERIKKVDQYRGTGCVIFKEGVKHEIVGDWEHKTFRCGKNEFNQYCTPLDSKRVKAILLGDGGYDNWAYSTYGLRRRSNTLYRNLDFDELMSIPKENYIY